MQVRRFKVVTSRLQRSHFAYRGMNISIQSKGALLKVEMSGSFTLAQAMACFRRIVESVAAHHPQTVLIDGRKISGPIAPFERFRFGVFVAETVQTLPARGISPMPIFAYVLAPDVFDPERRGEKAAVSRGFVGKAFTDLDEALRWLRSQRAVSRSQT